MVDGEGKSKTEDDKKKQKEVGKKRRSMAAIDIFLAKLGKRTKNTKVFL